MWLASFLPGKKKSNRDLGVCKPGMMARELGAGGETGAGK